MHDSDPASDGSRTTASRPGLKAILDALGDAVITTDSAFRVTSWNRAAEELYGWSEAEAIGRPTNEVVATLWANEATRVSAITTLTATGAWRGEVVQVRRDGRRVQVYSVVTTLRDGDGRANGAVAVNRDVTARHEAEAALRQVDARLDEVGSDGPLGRAAGDVAHDFGNLLVVIGGEAELLRLSLPDAAPTRASLDRIGECVARGAKIVGRLGAAARTDQLDATTFDASCWLRGHQDRLAAALGGHTLRIEAPDTPVWLRVGLAELEQALQNLCANAREAMPRPGKVMIELVVEAGVEAVLSVTDTGTGMTPEVRARALDAFFTTRPPGPARGLGLTVVAQLARRYDGSVDLVSAPGVGTRVSLRLPIADPPTRTRSRRPAPERPLRVLLAEDQDVVRLVLAELVRSLGHDVVLARDGREAVEIGAREPMDLLLTDVSMPGLSGPAAAAALRELRPDLPVIYLSGFPRPGEGAPGAWPEGIFRSKPVRLADLREAFTEALAWARQASSTASLPPP